MYKQLLSPGNSYTRDGIKISPLTLESDQLVLGLAQAQDTQELDELLEMFFSDEFVGFLDRYSNSLVAHSMLWSSMIRRIVFSTKDIRFPNKLFLLPPIYHQYGWARSSGNEWDILRTEMSDEFMLRPGLAHAMLLLFLDGMKLSLQEAIFLFQSRLAFLSKSPLEQQQGESLLEELHFFGWPGANIKYAAVTTTLQ